MPDAFTEANKVRVSSQAVDTVNSANVRNSQLESERLNREIAVAREGRAVIRDREELKTLQQNRQLALSRERRAAEQYERSKPTLEQLELQNEILTQQLQQTQSGLDKNDTYAAFDRYVADGDTRHFNNLMQNPRIKEALFGNEVASVDKIDVENDKLLMQQNGLDPSEFEGENADHAKYKYLKVTNSDGSKELVDITKILAGTGYLNHVDTQQAELALLKSKAQGKASKSGSDYSSVRNDAAALEEIYINQGMDPEEAKKKAGEETAARFNEGKPTAKQKELAEAEQRETNVYDTFGGEDNFYNTDFSKRENLIKVNKDVEAIERLKGIKFTAAQVKQLSNLKSAIDLAKTAGTKLNESQTGVLDNLLFNTKKYLTDEVGGIEGASAYAAYRNMVRHTLYGTALSKWEIAAFNEAFGSLKQKLGPALSQLKIGILQLKDELETISSIQNPVVAHVRLGSTEADVENIINALDERIKFLDAKSNGQEGLELLQSSEPKAPNLEQLRYGPDNVGPQGQGTNPAITTPVDKIKPLTDFNFSGGF